MRGWASILALIPGLAFGQLNLDPSSNWQSIVQTAAPSSWYVFAAGTYQMTNTPLTVTSAAVRLESESGPSSTYFVVAANTNVVLVTATNVVISGFTITGGDAAAAAGGVIGHGLTLVTNCVVVSNRNVGANATAGGLIGCTVFNSTIANNISTNSGDSGSGGVYFTHAAAVVDSCVVVSNISKTDGGGIGAQHNVPKGSIIDSTVRWNYAGGGGGAAHFGYATNSIFEFNSCGTRRGGGIGGYGGFVFAENCTIRSNSSAGGGGGAYRGAVLDSLIEYNHSAGGGGGASYTSTTNCTVRWNVSAFGNIGGAGAYYGDHEGSLFLQNTNLAGRGILYGGSASRCSFVSNSSGYSTAGSDSAGTSDAYVYSCLFAYNSPKTWPSDAQNNRATYNCTFISTNSVYVIAGGSANKDRVIANNLVVAPMTNPAIVDESGAAYTNVYANYFTNSATGLFLPDDPPYRAVATSPLRNAGNDTFATTPLDLYGRTRTQGQVDIGAVEFTPEADVAAGATMDRKKLLMLLLK